VLWHHPAGFSRTNVSMITKYFVDTRPKDIADRLSKGRHSDSLATGLFENNLEFSDDQL
jgi:hypothetical protein